MNRPEYWESDEKWEAYEAWVAQNPPPPPEPLTPLGMAVAKARGDVMSEQDLIDRIDRDNKLWAALKQVTRAPEGMEGKDKDGEA